ncbi:hypothetical protein FOZ62_027255, partial [Perkinsus olseni]
VGLARPLRSFADRLPDAFEVWVLGINELCEYSSRLKSLTRETFMLHKALSEDAGEEAPAGPTMSSFDHGGEQLPGGFMSLPELLKDQIRPLDRRSSAFLIKRTLSLDEVDALFDTIAATRREEGRR